MSNKQIMDACNRVSGIGNKKEVVKFLKQKATLLFLRDVLQPVLDIQDKTPIVLQIGRSNPSQYRKFVPYVAFFSVDAAEGYCICCTTPGLYKCRQCEQLTHLFDCSIVPKQRISVQYEKYQKLGEKAWIRKVLNSGLSGYDKKILEFNKTWNIANIGNPLHAHFTRGGRNLFSSVPYDTLHTLHKGLLQQVFMWTVSVIQLVGRVCQKHDKYKNSFLELDKRIDNFPRLHSVSPWGPFK